MPATQAVTSSSSGTVSGSTASEWYRVHSTGVGTPANTPRPACSTREVLPCMSSGAWETVAPNTSASTWWPRHTPNIGTAWSRQARTASIEAPASAGVPGPGETSTPATSRTSTVTASLRWTTVSAPSCRRYPTIV